MPQKPPRSSRRTALDTIEHSGEYAPREPWVGRLRYVIVPILAMLAIAAAIYVLEDKPSEAEVVQVQPASEGATGSARPVNVTASSAELAKVPAPRIGFPAPDFTLTSVDGKPTKLSEFRGQAVFLNFFASWCPPCRAEMPDIIATHDQYRESDALVLAVDLQEEQRIVRNYADAVGITFPIVLDTSGRVSALYRINAIPTSFFIDKDGIVREMQIGAMSKTMMQRKLEKAMGASGG